MGSPRWGSLFTTDALPVVYVQVPKAGCTSLLEALWKAHDRLTGQATYGGFGRASDGPWLKLRPMSPAEREAVLTRETFTVLREPLDRVWSAFHDKMRGPPNHIQAFFQERYGVAPDVDFDTFARHLAADPEPFRDRHFSPQAPLLRGLRIDHWFRLDRPEPLNAYLSERIGETLGRQNHNPAKPPLSIRTETADALRAYYAADYDLLCHCD